MYHLAVVLPIFFFTLLSFFYYIVFDRSGLRTLGTLVPVLGVTWIFGIFAMDQSTDIFQYIFVIANSLQVSLQVWFLWLQFFLFFLFLNILKSYSLESCDHSSLTCLWYQLKTLFATLQSLKQIFIWKRIAFLQDIKTLFTDMKIKLYTSTFCSFFKSLKGNIIQFTLSLHFVLLAQILLF